MTFLYVLCTCISINSEIINSSPFNNSLKGINKNVDYIEVHVMYPRYGYY